jgi:cell division protein FtsL
MRIRNALLILLLILVFSIIHLAIHTRNINLKYEVEELKGTLKKIQREKRDLGSTAAEKKNLGRIENIARNKLKMVRPDKINYVKSSTTEAAP